MRAIHKLLDSLDVTIHLTKAALCLPLIPLVVAIQLLGAALWALTWQVWLGA